MLAVIGGSGVYDIDGLENTRWVQAESPFGAPSDEVLLGELDGQPLAFLPRHGRGHRLPPSSINFRANIDALKRLGATQVVSVSAVGSLREDLTPGTFVIVDQFIDRTFAREKSFFGPGLVAHVSMGHPVCARLGDALAAAAAVADVRCVRGGFVPGDFNGDGRVDLEDLSLFLGCASGPAIALRPGCEFADLDQDGDVDQADFGIFQRCYGGEGNLPWQ